MKILLSAFACKPYAGSEGGVGWRWAVELAKLHEVVVVTDVTRSEAIEAELADHPIANLRFVYFRPRWLARVPLNSITAQLLYTAWQFSLLPFAKALHKKQTFDWALHITYSVFRHPSFLGFLGIPFVFGPLGGGEDAPFRLKKSFERGEMIRDILRAIINKLALVDPFLWCAYARTTVILTATQETKMALPWPFRKRAIVYPNLGVDSDANTLIPTRKEGDPMRILFVGRFHGLKGAHLAIRAVAEALRRKVNVEFTLVGQGPYESELRRVEQAEGVAGQIRWISHMPQQELFSVYQTMHCFLFPSLHDSGGSVVLEAQAKGLPVICLGIGGPATLVSAETGIVIDVPGLNEEDVVQRLADAIMVLANDEIRRAEMGRRALDHVASTMSWESRVRGVLHMLDACSHESSNRDAIVQNK
ncbi:MAG: glycosyltransferase family 4 protein [Gammaproteobacteria bacterium]|nr:glycosyltransferase family 4 protein [Gammaproteobacteria bacterium]MBU1481741.1 glycosyltransferase family 4 protein [Gammaproteobacteria bacterium]